VFFLIETYTGTPGSGKSLDMARKILLWLRMGSPVIGTVPINKDMIKKLKGKYYYVDIYNLDPKDLIEFSRRFCKKGKEKQVLLVVDECQRLFNARDWNAKDRRAWNDFFQVHRHFGYDILLVTQFIKLLDKQLIALVEYNHIHRKVSNFGIGGMIISAFTFGRLFVSVHEWYPIKAKLGSDFFLYKKKLGDLYDSYMAFDEDHDDSNELKLLFSASENDRETSPEVAIGISAAEENIDEFLIDLDSKIIENTA